MSEVISLLPRVSRCETLDKDTLIVVTNHLGSDVRGDTMLNAQYLADVSGHPVVGLNRPGTGDDATLSFHMAKDITRHPDDVVDAWADRLKPAIAKHSPSKIELVSNSAGANVMLHVAANQLLDGTVGVLALEPLRFEPVNTLVGQARYVHYQLSREGTFKDYLDEIVDHDLPPDDQARPADAANPRKIVRRQLIDIGHYMFNWSSDLAYRHALYIAGHVPITAAVTLADESMAVEPPHEQMYVDRLNRTRADSGLTQRMAAKVLALTTHGSFDSRPLYATEYRKFAALVAADSA